MHLGLHSGPFTENACSVQNILNHWRLASTILAPGLHHLIATIQYMATLSPRGCLPFQPIQWWAMEAWVGRGGGGGRDGTCVFLHWKPSIKDMYRSHISKWIVEVFKTAYLSSEELDGVCQIRLLLMSYMHSHIVPLHLLILRYLLATNQAILIHAQV